MISNCVLYTPCQVKWSLGQGSQTRGVAREDILCGPRCFWGIFQ